MTGCDAWLYDGESAIRHEVSVVAEDEASFTLHASGRADEAIRYAELLRRDDSGGRASFARKARPGWRLILPADVPAEIAAHLPGARRYGGFIDRIGLWPAALACAVVAAVVIVIFVNTPPLLARAIPASVERQLGEAMVGDFGRKGCATPEGDAALAALVKRIDPYDPTLEVSVVRIPVINAVTLPGGRIVLFDGLIQAARSPDEVAGVIGHEIGHVRHRDVLESLLRQFGLSILLGGMEGHVGNYTNALLASSYSRKAESGADEFAIELMKEAKVSPAATAGFFNRLGGGTKGAKAERVFSYVASHPVSADRATRFAKAVEPRAAYRPALDPEEWRALRTMCRATPKEDDSWRF